MDLRSTMSILLKSHTDPPLFAPDDMARRMMSVRNQDQCEVIRNPDGAAYIKRSSEMGHIADHAIDCAAVDLNRSGL